MGFRIGKREIGINAPTYFIADIGANHDGSFERACELIRLAKEAGADAAKFQNFRAEKIVSKEAFDSLSDKDSHQSKWKESVFEVYKKASLPFEWTNGLKDECDRVGIDYFSSPYDFDAIDMLDPFVPAFKVGSGDIDWVEALQRMAKKGKPVLLATGASTIMDVDRAIHAVLEINSQLCLMQCNTNYTGADSNFDHIHLNVLKSYSAMYPDLVLGLSDHTSGHATVLGAVALGARVIEKHFTDDKRREGPDHPFAMDPRDWAEMVARTRELERALGSTGKFVAENEEATKYVQRRCIRFARDMKAGEIIQGQDVEILRPYAEGSCRPYELDQIVGLRVHSDQKRGDAVKWTEIVR